ncbi:MAG: hypothetical protein JRN26_04640 [Nitrososphaerota archaeon]|jgi:hypothetical protein|nr:hypothetical protein [Nitrososphaerota archaeon]MDG6927854.1 hypothetical protein [Nitrososphaerota archaeon]MDG6931282.1 hypothetical protein [Nitrososphaerota archaeon]MDG6932149.1 hypothetical protein [Nitrososphaerota archaeon]MDG6936152.1 hypothetical protein [Nitrososphaerota archaeon]
MSFGWIIWLVPVLFGILGPYFKLKMGYASFFAGAIFALSATFDLIGNPIGAIVTAVLLGLPLLLVVVFGFLIGAGITAIIYYIAAKFMDIGESD